MYEFIRRAAPLRDASGDLPLQDQLVAENLARVLVRLRRAGVHLDQQGEFTKGGKVKPVAEYERRLLNVALAHFEQLGFTARSRAALGIDVQRGLDLATALSEPDADRRREALEALGVEEDEGG